MAIRHATAISPLPRPEDLAAGLAAWPDAEGCGDECPLACGVALADRPDPLPALWVGFAVAECGFGEAVCRPAAAVL
jgi:hypothetical protein